MGRFSLGRVAFPLAVVLVIACTGAAATIGPGPYDAAAAKVQAATFATYATPNSLGNYGEQFTTFCTVKFGFDCNRPDRSQAEDLVSGEEIAKIDAEKNNPTAIVSDIGILFIPQAETVGVLANYEPPNANLLPPELHGPGWIATFVGVPAILVNVGFLEAHNLPVPESWSDLANPVYAGKIGFGRVGVSSSGTWAFVAMNLAAGGTVDDYTAGIAYAKRLLPNLTQQATIDTFEKGEVPISVRFDFQHGSWLETLRQRGVNARLIVPTDGSVYSTSTLLMNKYDVAHADFGKMFMEWVLTDEAQVIFAKFGARPIRSVIGDNRVTVPAELRTNWLPDEDYANVRTVDFRKIDSDEIGDIWENQVLAGN